MELADLIVVGSRHVHGVRAIRSSGPLRKTYELFSPLNRTAHPRAEKSVADLTAIFSLIIVRFAAAPGGAEGRSNKGRSSFPTSAIRMGCFALLVGRAM
jgi:hypothetical protein